VSEQKNALYWSYNLPLQVWPRHEDCEDADSRVVGARILNYMPRKERCETVDLAELLGEQTREEYFETAALHLENLARLMRKAAADPSFAVYYADCGMDK
jgi:hypothetical protein